MKTRSQARREREQKNEIPERKVPEFLIDTPGDIVNEQIILAAEMCDPDIRKTGVKAFPPDAFYGDQHKLIQAGLLELTRRNLEYDPAVLLRLSPDVDIRIVEGLMAARPDAPKNLQHHFDTLSWDWQRMKVAQGPFGSLLEAFQDPNEAPEKVKSLAKQVYEAFDQAQGSSRFLRDPKQVVKETMDTLRKRVAGEAYFPYGIPGLDRYEDGRVRLRPGAAPGAITLVSALSGSGKSSVCSHMALQIARQRRRVLFGAWEEEAPSTLESLTVLALGWSRSMLLDGGTNHLKEHVPMTHEELVTFEETAHKISKWITFFDNPFQHGRTKTARRVTNNDHLDIIEDHITQSGCAVFFADLLHRCFVDDSPSDEKLALNRFLAITQDCKIHSIAAHQQRAKDIETRANKRPTREGIIGAGAWLDIPWTVIAPHIPAKWKNVPDTTLEMIILKQRNGPWPLGIEFDWDPDTGQISGGTSIDVKHQGETSHDAFGISKSPTSRRFGSRAS